MSKDAVVHKGLEGIYVDTTSISKIDGELGELFYRQHSIEDLVKKTFEEVAFLVIAGHFPNKTAKQELELFLSKYRELSGREIAILRNVPPNTHPMKVLQSLIPLVDVSLENKLLADALSQEARKALAIAAKLPSIIAAYHRIRSGKEAISREVGLSFHENFLYQLNGKLPRKEEVAVLDITQILQMEHGFNASTFAARVTASTLAPIECAISAAVGTLYGKLHGGADQAALEMILRIEKPQDTEAFILDMLAQGQKIMGMGHRVYRVVDPRAKILKPLGQSLCHDTPFQTLFETFEKVEAVMEDAMAKKGKRVKANIEFYKGPVFYSLGIVPEYFTPLFAMSRVFGYAAHILESREDNKLIRPKALYVAT